MFFCFCSAWRFRHNRRLNKPFEKVTRWVASVKIKTQLQKYLISETYAGHVWFVKAPPGISDSVSILIWAQIKKSFAASFHPTAQKTKWDRQASRWHLLGSEASVKLFSHSAGNMCAQTACGRTCRVSYVDARRAWPNTAVSELHCLKNLRLERLQAQRWSPKGSHTL